MRRRRQEEGTSIIEVVIALGILLILMIGILQMFSMAFLMNLNSAASTEMAYKGQQVSEIIRWALYQRALGQPIGTGANALPLTALAPGATYTIPDTSSGANWNFWGPAYMAVQTNQNPPYTIAYTVTETPELYEVTVAVTAKHTSAPGYVGVAKKGKVVTYVVQAPKAAP